MTSSICSIRSSRPSVSDPATFTSIGREPNTLRRRPNRSSSSRTRIALRTGSPPSAGVKAKPRKGITRTLLIKLRRPIELILPPRIRYPPPVERCRRTALWGGSCPADMMSADQRICMARSVHPDALQPRKYKLSRDLSRSRPARGWLPCGVVVGWNCFSVSAPSLRLAHPKGIFKFLVKWALNAQATAIQHVGAVGGQGAG